MSQTTRGNEPGPEFLLVPPVLSAKKEEKITFDGFDGVHTGEPAHEDEPPTDMFESTVPLQEELIVDEQDSDSFEHQENRESFSSSEEARESLQPVSPQDWSSNDGVHRVTSNDDIHRVTSEAKLYHPKPQRLVSAALAESSDVLNGRTMTDDPITTEIGSPQDQISHSPSFDQSSASSKYDDSDSILQSPEAEYPSEEVESLKGSQEPSIAEKTDDQQSISAHTSSEQESTSQNSLSPREYTKSGPAPADARPFHESFQQRQSTVSSQYQNDERLAYYPAPVPLKLLLPPLLSGKRTSRPAADFVDPQRLSNRVSVGLSGGVRRRSSQILAPPIWFINADDARRASMYGISRSPSPALSIDSGRATLEDEEDYQDLGDDTKVEETKTKEKKKSKKKKKNVPDYLESDMDDEEDEERLKQMQQHDAIAFSHYDPSALNHTQLLTDGGGVLPTKKMSLIEELEFRKAKKKNQRRLVLQEKAMVEANGNPNMHPLDARMSRTLLELQYVHDVGYEEDNHLRILQRHKQLEEQKVEEGPENGQSLKQLRRQLKEGKKQQELEATETLAQRRRRLKTAKVVDIAA